MTALQLIKDEYENSYNLFEGTVGDLTQEQLDMIPGGKALPIGAVFAHCITSEDIILNKMVQNKSSILELENIKGKKIISIELPIMDENWSQANSKWANEVRVDLELIKQYSVSVHNSTLEYFTSLVDADLDQEIELGNWGKMKLSYVLDVMIIAHRNSLAGEISALKGIQGSKGYPF